MTLLCHVDGGAIEFIFTKRERFWKYSTVKTKVRQTDDSYIHAVGISIVIIRIETIVIPLHSCYHIIDNPQFTFSLSELKKYDHFQSARVESLSWTRLLNKYGKTVRITSNKEKILLNESQDYINVDIIKP